MECYRLDKFPKLGKKIVEQLKFLLNYTYSLQSCCLKFNTLWI